MQKILICKATSDFHQRILQSHLTWQKLRILWISQELYNYVYRCSITDTVNLWWVHFMKLLRSQSFEAWSKSFTSSHVTFLLYGIASWKWAWVYMLYPGHHSVHQEKSVLIPLSDFCMWYQKKKKLWCTGNGLKKKHLYNYLQRSVTVFGISSYKCPMQIYTLPEVQAKWQHFKMSNYW